MASGGGGAAPAVAAPAAPVSLKLGTAIVDPPAPQNPVHIQARINPRKDFNLQRQDVRDSDYFVPPFCPVFVKSGASTSPYAKTHATKKNMREGLVHDAVCNFYDNKNAAAKRFNGVSLRFVGVSYDGIADMKGAERHPDSIGRFSVIVSGAVTIAVNPDDMKTASIGDKLFWEDVCNGFHYPTYPDDFSPVKVTSAPAAGTPANNVIGMVIGFNAKRNEVRVLLTPECSEFKYTIEGVSSFADTQAKVASTFTPILNKIYEMLNGLAGTAGYVVNDAKLNELVPIVEQARDELQNRIYSINTSAQAGDDSAAAATAATGTAALAEPMVDVRAGSGSKGASDDAAAAESETKTKRRRTAKSNAPTAAVYESYEA